MDSSLGGTLVVYPLSGLHGGPLKTGRQGGSEPTYYSFKGAYMGSQKASPGDRGTAVRATNLGIITNSQTNLKATVDNTGT